MIFTETRMSVFVRSDRKAQGEGCKQGLVSLCVRTSAPELTGSALRAGTGPLEKGAKTRDRG